MINFNKSGYGICRSSFGEIIQGRKTNNEDFLISLPIKLNSSCKIKIEKIDAPLIVECDRQKTKDLVTILFQKMKINWGYYVKCNLESDIPISKGLSSSTADMVAAARAVENLFNISFDKKLISKVFKIIEPHEGLHYSACTLYNHVKGKLISYFEYIPSFYIVAIDRGGVVDTLEFNKNIKYTFSQKKMSEKNLKRIIGAFKNKDDLEIAKCATISSQILAERCNYKLNKKAVSFVDEVKSIGVVSAHSGTYIGFLYAKNESNIKNLKKYKSCIREKFKKKVTVYETVNYIY
ncbi:hypothetical protein OAP58_02405 [Candidatus Pelagibacter sp.]|nr:hypothetical protein [Candidatus Pelagibacter sp.]